MPSIGHGISDAVRNHIPIWVDPNVANLLYDEYKNDATNKPIKSETFRSIINKPDAWVRTGRKKTSTGFERHYSCKSIGKVSLIVHSPPEDKSANGYAFYIGKTPVAGGKTKLQSTHVSIKVSSKDKTSSRYEDAVFIQFTKEELEAMSTIDRFGDGLSRLETEREV